MYLQIDRPDLADQAVPPAPPRAVPEAVRDIFDVVNEEAAVLPADGPAVLANLAHFLQKRLDGEEGTWLQMLESKYFNFHFDFTEGLNTKISPFSFPLFFSFFFFSGACD